MDERKEQGQELSSESDACSPTHSRKDDQAQEQSSEKIDLIKNWRVGKGNKEQNKANPKKQCNPEAV